MLTSERRLPLHLRASVLNIIVVFNAAIVRRPGTSVIHGLRADDGPTPRLLPTYEGVRREHEAYVAALVKAGIEDIVVLDPLEAFPDSVFVEDPALVFSEGAVLLRPGAPSRREETAALAPTLHAYFDVVLGPPTAGFVDGGDVLTTPHAVIVGLSERTDKTGAQWLVAQLERLGRRAIIVDTPQGILHFKTACALLDPQTVLVTAPMARAPVFEAFKKVVVPDGEAAAANALRINDTVFVGADFPKTIALLRSEGYTVHPLPTAEIGRLDAGLSCMSLRWRR